MENPRADLLRDLCIRKAEEDKFLHVKNFHDVILYKSNGDPKRLRICDLLGKYSCMRKADENVKKVMIFSDSRRVSVHASYRMKDVYASPQSMSLARSFLSIGGDIQSSLFSGLRFLRVLDVMKCKFRVFPREVLQLVNLRYLAINSSLPSEISRLWNLQTLIASTHGQCVPFEIWELPELRHLKMNGVIWFEKECVKRISAKKKLQTTSMIALSDELIEIGFLESIPEITRLELYIPILLSNALDLTHLHKLEALTCKSDFDGRAGNDSLPMFIFPSTLRKLTLMNLEIFPRVLTALSELWNLEILDLIHCHFEREAERDEECKTADEEWEAAEGDVFRSLQFLSLSLMWSLKRWTADETNFPRLRHLVLRNCWALEEIPCGFGEIPTLELIELERCNGSFVASAKQIVEEQQTEFDNYDLKLSIIS